jgi:hypothetical protein
MELAYLQTKTPGLVKPGVTPKWSISGTRFWPRHLPSAFFGGVRTGFLIIQTIFMMYLDNIELPWIAMPRGFACACC